MDDQDPAPPYGARPYDPPAQGTPAQGTQRPIRRDTVDGMVGGVAAGLARSLGVDVVWVRLAFVLLTVLGGGVGVLLYLAAWLVIPRDDDRDAMQGVRAGTGDASGMAGPARGPAFWVGVGLVTIGGLILLDNVLSPLTARLTWVSTEELILPIVLIGLGALIYRSSRAADVAPATVPDAPSSPHDTGTARLEERVERWSEEVEQRAATFEARREARAASVRETRSGSRIAPLTLGLALMTLGGVWLLGSFGVPGLTLPRALAGALLVIGLGLLVGAFLGRGRGLVAAGLLLTPAVLVATLAGQVLDGIPASAWSDGMAAHGAGEFVERPTTLADLPELYATGLGGTVIDLRAPGLVTDLASAGTTELAIAHGIGELTVLVPPDVTVELDVTLGIGEIVLPGSDAAGIRPTLSDTLLGTAPEDGRLVLTIAQGLGAVKVSR